MLRFQGRVVVLTGAGSGIGAATALRFAAEGASVVVSDINGGNADRVVAAIVRASGRAMAVRADVSVEQDVSDLVDRALSEYASLDVMVNNAGIGETAGDIDTLDASAWQRTINVNLNGVFYGVKHAVRAMKAKRVKGSIINVSSILGLVGLANAAAYTAAKHGVMGLTKAAALELAAIGIRVNAVNPAFIQTPMIAGMEDAVLPLHPMARLGTPEEVAAMICFLASDDASFVTGASYLVDGGYVAK